MFSHQKKKSVMFIVKWKIQEPYWVVNFGPGETSHRKLLDPVQNIRLESGSNIKSDCSRSLLLKFVSKTLVGRRWRVLVSLRKMGRKDDNQKQKMGREDGKRINRKRNEDDDKQKSIPVLPWMRTPIDVSALDEKPLPLLPCLDPR